MPRSTISVRTVLSSIVVAPHGQGRASIQQPFNDQHRFMPFLLLDVLSVQGKSSGFGDHPHRGQETMTYMLEGQLVHQDSNGGEGVLNPGDMQVMCAGRGIVHNETPVVDPKTNGNKGIQLWVALPASNINDPPTYQDIVSKKMPVSNPAPGVKVKIIAGESFGKAAKQLTKAPVWYLDITLEPGSEVHHPIPSAFNCFMHILAGNPTAAGKSLATHETLFWNRDGDSIHLSNRDKETAHILVFAGDPLEDQQVYQYGPFVSNTAHGIQLAMMDFQRGKNGFEKARRWESNTVHN